MAYSEDSYEIAPELKDINERQVGILDQENTDGQGWDYYCNGQIIRAAVLGNRITGTVREYIEEFNVEIRVDRYEITTSCTCGTRQGVCKHIVALLYSWIHDKEDFINIGDHIKRLHDMNKQELIDVIERIIQNDPINVRFFSGYSYDEGGLDIEDLIV
ncbi:MAG: SWIM zinc finger family protein [bacterium]|nr:MAG: SWIM zinc finger family protein [bacterium]